ncbi:hypothetical protein [Actinokineospora iranica]|nr:hypothetical protein [Actinokineospora iranica]
MARPASSCLTGHERTHSVLERALDDVFYTLDDYVTDPDLVRAENYVRAG